MSKEKSVEELDVLNAYGPDAPVSPWEYIAALNMAIGALNGGIELSKEDSEKAVMCLKQFKEQYSDNKSDDDVQIRDENGNPIYRVSKQDFEMIDEIIETLSEVQNG